MAARRRTVATAPPSGSSAPSPPRPRARTWGAPLLVGAAALLAYANSLGNGFVWDDPIILTRQLVVFRSAGDVLAPPRDIPQFSPDYYRPLTIATYLLDRAAGGEQPFAFHVSVVLAHAATSVLVYALAWQLLGGFPRRTVRQPAARGRAGSPDRESAWTARSGEVGAFTAALLFALHPIHTESVAWAAGRSDVLATGFLLAVLVLHRRARRTWAGSLAAGLCTAAALGAKETAVAVYPLLLLGDLLVPSPARRTAADWWRGYAGPLLAGVLYLALRRNALGEVVGSAPDALPAGGRSAADLVGALGTYVGKILWPVHLNAYIDHIAVDPLTVALAALLLGGLALAAWDWWRRRAAAAGGRASQPARDAGLPLFGLVWMVLTLAPSLAIVWKIPDAPLAERYLYLPSVGFCLLAGVLVARLWASTAAPHARLAGGAVLAIVMIGAAAATVRRNPVWHDDIALWEDTELRSQVSGMAARGLGTAYQQAGRTADARAAFERALTRRNTPRGLQTAYNNLGTLAMYDGDYAAARRDYEAALQANPDAADSLFNLGLAILQGGGRSREAAQAALPYYERALRVNPHDSDIEAALAQVFDILGRPSAAAEHARRALDLGARGQTADSLRAMLARVPPP